MTERPHPDTPLKRHQLILRLEVQDPTNPDRRVTISRIYAHMLEGAPAPEPTEIIRAVRETLHAATASVLDVIWDNLNSDENEDK